MSVAAIVPARDEGGRVGVTVRTLRAVPDVDEVIVVDDGSRDETATEAAAAGANVLAHRRARGKGAALATGTAATAAEVVVFIDADLQESAAIAEVLLAPVLDGEADMTVAAPPPAEPSGFGLVERFAAWGIERLTGRRLARPLSGQRALRREVLARARRPAHGFGVEAALTIDALRAGFRILEVPAAVSHRRTGRDLAGFNHRARQGIQVARVLAARALPLRR